jgi:hypothetical protein
MTHWVFTSETDATATAAAVGAMLVTVNDWSLLDYRADHSMSRFGDYRSQRGYLGGL